MIFKIIESVCTKSSPGKLAVDQPVHFLGTVLVNTDGICYVNPDMAIGLAQHIMNASDH